MAWGFLTITLSLASFPCVQLAWPFVTDGWFEAFGSISHVGPDAKAQDWLRSAHHGATRGEPVLAPMNGSISAMSAGQAGPIRPLCISWIEPNVRRAKAIRAK